MSAFIVSEEHINAILNAALDYSVPYGVYWGGPDGDRKRLTSDNVQEVADMLMADNVRSVEARYACEGATPVCRFRRAPQAHTPVEILKALDCLEYQCCEYRGWEESEAHAFRVAVRRAAIRHLPGYEGAAWEIR